MRLNRVCAVKKPIRLHLSFKNNIFWVGRFLFECFTLKVKQFGDPKTFFHTHHCYKHNATRPKKYQFPKKLTKQ